MENEYVKKDALDGDDTELDASYEDLEINNGVLLRYHGKSDQIILPDGLTTIGDKAFNDCKSLRSIEITGKTISIEEKAFNGCINLRRIIIPSDSTELLKSEIKDCLISAGISENIIISKLHVIQEQIIALRNSEEFKKLDDYYRKKSFFSILGITRKENRHNDFLFWLLNPAESHELGNLAIEKLLELSVMVKNTLQMTNIESKIPEGIDDDISSGNYRIENVYIDREHPTTKQRRIDLFIEFEYISPKISNGGSAEDKRKIVIILENKIGAQEDFYEGEGQNGEDLPQTVFYYNYGEKRDGEKIYLYLKHANTIEYKKATEPDCECKHYLWINYQYLTDYVIEPCLLECKQIRAKTLIEEYLKELSQPSLCSEKDREKADTSKGVMIMAIPSKEKDLLLRFWESNEELLRAVHTARSQDDTLDEEERKLSESIANKRTGKIIENIEIKYTLFKDVKSGTTDKAVDFYRTAITAILEKYKNNAEEILTKRNENNEVIPRFGFLLLGENQPDKSVDGTKWNSQSSFELEDCNKKEKKVIYIAQNYSRDNLLGNLDNLIKYICTKIDTDKNKDDICTWVVERIFS